ncbi:MAG: histidine phosphatase family protein [Anaerolineales bacterium]|jgi:phosphohistidine phosphatase
MKTLLILRHAKSSWKDVTLADHERPLNKRGSRDAPRMGELLRYEQIIPDLIITSTAKRALMTVEALVETSGYDGEVHLTNDFYHASTEAFLAILSQVPDEYQCVMVVGHNPGLEVLIDVLTGEYLRMPTAALAQVSLPIQNWAEIYDEVMGVLVDYWRPKEL